MMSQVETKSPEEMDFHELEKNGLIHPYAVLNYKILQAYIRYRKEGLNAAEAYDKLGAEFYMSDSNAKACVRKALDRRKYCQ
ncbi:MAG: hypothetical protein HBSAPP04_14590 [Ignavibacteriaceae bacterium]|nr:MAG: hypothetical protein HBSAPP04_14590 [Ignavibacteriaceae bacterium]